MKATKIKLSTSSKVFYIICYTVVALMAIICLIPFILLISGSFTAEQWIRFHGYGLIPGEFSTEAYNIIFKTPARPCLISLPSKCLAECTVGKDVVP